MVEIKTHRDHPASMDERVRRRYRNSGGEEADSTTKVGEGPNRLFHNQHNKGNVMQRGEDNKGEGDIFNHPRGVNNPKGQIP
jgi:hypothetical protein